MTSKDKIARRKWQSGTKFSGGVHGIDRNVSVPPDWARCFTSNIWTISPARWLKRWIASSTPTIPATTATTIRSSIRYQATACIIPAARGSKTTTRFKRRTCQGKQAANILSRPRLGCLTGYRTSGLEGLVPEQGADPLVADVHHLEISGHKVVRHRNEGAFRLQAALEAKIRGDIFDL